MKKNVKMINVSKVFKAAFGKAIGKIVETLSITWILGCTLYLYENNKMTIDSVTVLMCIVVYMAGTFVEEIYDKSWYFEKEVEKNC